MKQSNAQHGPQFLILEDPSYRSFTEALAVFWEAAPPVESIGLCGSRARPKSYLPVPGLFSSALLHYSLALFLFRVPLPLLAHHTPGMERTDQGHPVQQIVYVLRPSHPRAHFPTVKPDGPGGMPGQGSQPRHLPARGSTAFHPTLTVISNPPHPDNFRKTIIQPPSPPDLKMSSDVRLPNVLIGALADPPPPKQAIPSPTLPLPADQSRQQPSAIPASTLALAPSPTAVSNPALPLPLSAASPAPPPPANGVSDSVSDRDSSTKARATTPGLLSLSVDAAPAAESIAVLPGNLRGAFSISPASGLGSPGGIAGGDLRGGLGGNGSSGDGSAAIGPGRAGGGGGDTTSAVGGISISGRSGGSGDGGEGVLPSFFAGSLVYPVSPPRPQRPGMVVTAGPAGGGGLNVYGVLKGGKIYTTYLLMPGKHWILQYCVRDDPPVDAARPSRSIEVRVGPNVVPPSPEAQFDFHRVPLSQHKVREMIILHGVIREDGTVHDLRVLQGLLQTVDEAALAAFSRWRFKPAQQDGRPISVEVLVGIPTLVPGT